MSEATTLEVEEAARADLYALLATLFARPPGAELLERLSALDAAGDSDIAQGLAALAAAARAAEPEAVRREYEKLFIGLSRGEFLPYASYYMTGFLQDRPLAALRDDMTRLGLERAPGRREPEDHFAFICEMMAGLIRGAFGGGPASVKEQRAMFEAHLAPWAKRFLRDVEDSETSAFYAPVARLGRAFMALEADAFRASR